MQTDSPHFAASGLYREHHAWLVSWLTRKLRDGAEAADLAHDTFVRVIGRDVDELSAVNEPRAWLTSIAKRLMVDHWRRREIERAYLEALAALPEPVAPSPEARLLVLEALLALDALLDGLKPATRCALLWARVEGMTVPEVARRLGVSVATAERHLAKALRHCYEHIYAA